MQETEAVIYHSANHKAHQTMDNLHRLITLERAQKLDLLIHLINNLSQALVVCGPEGIGKTTLLDVLVEQKKDNWHICRIDGSSRLSFESCLEQLTRQLDETRDKDLNEVLNLFSQQNHKVVWIIDDAGELVPGLITSLIDFAKGFDCLRLVFMLTHDELHVKSSTDKQIEDCHLIEIPPLKRNDYTTFLQNQSAQPGAAISFNAVNDGLVDNLYKKTHGIPGKIMQELPHLASLGSASPLKWGGSLLVLAGIVIAATLLYLNKPETGSQARITNNSPVFKQSVTQVDISAPVLESEDTGDTENNQPVEPPAPEEITVSENDWYQPQKKIEADSVSLDEKPIVETDTVIPKPVSTPVEKIPTGDSGSKVEVSASPVVKEKPSTEALLKEAEVPEKVTKDKAQMPVTPVDPLIEQQPVQPKLAVKPKPNPIKPAATEKNAVATPSKPVSGIVWLKQQNPDYYTLQLMVLSSVDSVKKLLKQYPVLKKTAKYFAIRKNGKQQYVVVTGSYQSRDKAKKARQTLPGKLKKAWIRSFKILQKQLS